MNAINERLQYCILFCNFSYKIVNMYVFIHYVGKYMSRYECKLLSIR